PDEDVTDNSAYTVVLAALLDEETNFGLDLDYDDFTVNRIEILNSANCDLEDYSEAELSWEGNSFSAVFSESCDNSTWSYEISGEVSDTFDRLIKFEGKKIYTYNEDEATVTEHRVELTIEDLDLSIDEDNTDIRRADVFGGNLVQAHVTHYLGKYTEVIGRDNIEWNVTSIPWQSSSLRLSILFIKE
ncbi:MAG: hypothetical protein KAH17_06555, partial [Bacteroidales bacterium]|nr:hypothetical protein [Bacteroidales bacterium]